MEGSPADQEEDGSRFGQSGSVRHVATKPRPASNSPAVAVRGVCIDAELNQKLDDLGVAGADGVVQRCDALIVRPARVVHLQTVQTVLLIHGGRL